MSPDIVKNKLQQLASLVEDLKKFEKVTYQEFLDRHHYTIERILELLVVTAHSALLHVFSLQGEEMPTTYRTTFLRAGELNMIPRDLAQNLADAAGMRNLLVHDYSMVDMEIVYKSIKPAIRDFARFNKHLAAFMNLSS